MFQFHLHQLVISVPSGLIQSINQTSFELKESLHFNWTDILPMEKRGIITHWNISLNKIENAWDLTNDTTQYFRVEPDVYHLSISSLNNYTEYTIGITGYTAVGAGPMKTAVYRTATNGKLLEF